MSKEPEEKQVVEEGTEQSPGAEEAQTQTEADEAVEHEASENGWVPKERYRGNPEDWIDAATFVKRGRELNPLLRKNNEKLLRELNNARSELAELKLTTKEFSSEFAKMKENAYKRAIADLKAQKREARAADDEELVDELEERIDELKANQPKPAEESKAPAPKPDMTVFNEWHSENKWYDEEKNPEMFDAAEGIALRLSRSEKGLVGKPFMDRVSEEVRKRFPEHFENPRREKSPHEGSKSRGTTQPAHSYANLPADAKAACDRQVKQGWLTREQYIEAYEWE